MRMKILPICLALTSLLLGGCADKPSRPAEPVADTAIPVSIVMFSRYSRIFIRQPRRWCVMIVTGWLIFRLHRHSVTRWNKLFTYVFLRPSPRQSEMRCIMPCVIPDIVCARRWTGEPSLPSAVTRCSVSDGAGSPECGVTDPCRSGLAVVGG